MKVLNLTSKLNKMNTLFVIVDVNGYNKDIVFQVNGKTFKAGFTDASGVVEDFCQEICWDNSEQEMQRTFYKNFNQLLISANA